MTSIKTIDLIVYPFYDLQENREGNLNLVGDIVKYAHKNGSDLERLFVLIPGDIDNLQLFRDPEGTTYAQYIHDYYQRMAHFIGDLISETSHLYVGSMDDFKEYGTYGEDGQSKFHSFLRSTDLELSVDELRLIGHGLHQGHCVRKSLQIVANAIDDQHGTRVPFEENESTTYIPY